MNIYDAVLCRVPLLYLLNVHKYHGIPKFTHSSSHMQGMHTRSAPHGVKGSFFTRIFLQDLADRIFTAFKPISGGAIKWATSKHTKRATAIYGADAVQYHYKKVIQMCLKV